ncbi:MAG: hypothetical protein CM15mV24_2120 [Bellamyvirus sp.]|nr:MAG: hypothetical protein CM15mV24_2120 [Bellamyvirus sp.]
MEDIHLYQELQYRLPPSGGITGIASAVMIGGINVCNQSANPAARSVQNVDIVNPGAGYTVTPGVQFIGGGGAGAAATATDR